MLLGASFAFGWGVDYELSFAGVLQHLLQGGGFARKKKIEIINAGVPAMTMAAQLSWFERIGKGYVPDLVIQLEYGSMLEEWAGESYPLAFAAVDDDGYLVRWINAVSRFERFKSFATGHGLPDRSRDPDPDLVVSNQGLRIRHGWRWSQ